MSALGLGLGLGLARRGAAPRYLVLTEGDSLTAAEAFGPPDTSYPKYLRDSLNGNYLVVNDGTSGEESSQILAQTLRNDRTNFSDARAQNIVVVMIGTNDLFFDRTEASIKANIEAICGRYRAWGWRVLVGTITKSNIITVGNGRETIRQNVNTWIRANYTTWADGVVDKDARSEFNDPTNPTYFSDGTHYTIAASQLVAQLTRTEILALQDLAFTSPGRIAGCKAWFRPEASLINVVGGLCTAIVDRSGNALVASQIESAAPTWVAQDSTTPWNIPNISPAVYHPSLTFSSGKSLANTTQDIIAAGASRSVIAVTYTPNLNPGGGAAVCFRRSGVYNSCQTRWADEGNIRAYSDGTSIGRLTIDAGNVKKWTHWKFTGTGNPFAVTQNGTAQTIAVAKNQTAESGSTGFIIGNDVAGAHLDGNLVDLIVCDSIVDDAVNSPLRHYLARYGFSGG